MGLALDEPKENEKTELINDLEFLMDDQVKSYAEGQVVDYVDSFGGQGFVITPSYGTGCG